MANPEHLVPATPELVAHGLNIGANAMRAQQIDRVVEKRRSPAAQVKQWENAYLCSHPLQFENRPRMKISAEHRAVEKQKVRAQREIERLIAEW